MNRIDWILRVECDAAPPERWQLMLVAPCFAPRQPGTVVGLTQYCPLTTGQPSNSFWPTATEKGLAESPRTPFK
jgi:hypothetical protein